MKRILKLAAATCLAVVLAACGGGSGGGGSGGAAVVASSDLVLAVDARTGNNVVTSLSGQTFTFDGGVPAFGTAGTTTLAVTATGGTPTFAVGAGGGTATGTLGFGSCIFRVSNSTIPSMPNGSTITVNPCSIKVDLAGQPAALSAVSREVTITLGLTPSRANRVPVVLNSDGSVTVNGASLGTLTLTLSGGS